MQWRELKNRVHIALEDEIHEPIAEAAGSVEKDNRVFPPGLPIRSTSPMSHSKPRPETANAFVRLKLWFSFSHLLILGAGCQH